MATNKNNTGVVKVRGDLNEQTGSDAFDGLELYEVKAWKFHLRGRGIVASCIGLPLAAVVGLAYLDAPYYAYLTLAVALGCGIALVSLTQRFNGKKDNSIQSGADP